MGNGICNVLVDKSFTRMQDTSFISSHPGQTAIYNAIHDETGDLFTAVADMKMHDSISAESVRKHLNAIQPTFIAFDGNVSVSVMEEILRFAAEKDIPGISLTISI